MVAYTFCSSYTFPPSARATSSSYGPASPTLQSPSFTLTGRAVRRGTCDSGPSARGIGRRPGALAKGAATNYNSKKSIEGLQLSLQYYVPFFRFRDSFDLDVVGVRRVFWPAFDLYCTVHQIFQGCGTVNDVSGGWCFDCICPLYRYGFYGMG